MTKAAVEPGAKVCGGRGGGRMQQVQLHQPLPLTNMHADHVALSRHFFSPYTHHCACEIDPLHLADLSGLSRTAVAMSGVRYDTAIVLIIRGHVAKRRLSHGSGGVWVGQPVMLHAADTWQAGCPL